MADNSSLGRMSTITDTSSLERLSSMADTSGIGRVVTMFSIAECQKHRDREDCWIVIAGKVYEFSFLSNCTVQYCTMRVFPWPQFHRTVMVIAVVDKYCLKVIKSVETSGSSSQVYDVTSFLDDHPGGDEIILNDDVAGGNSSSLVHCSL